MMARRATSPSAVTRFAALPLLVTVAALGLQFQLYEY